MYLLSAISRFSSARLQRATLPEIPSQVILVFFFWEGAAVEAWPAGCDEGPGNDELSLPFSRDEALYDASA
jgi:hypothetical protein